MTKINLRKSLMMVLVLVVLGSMFTVGFANAQEIGMEDIKPEIDRFVNYLEANGYYDRVIQNTVGVYSLSYEKYENYGSMLSDEMSTPDSVIRNRVDMALLPHYSHYYEYQITDDSVTNYIMSNRYGISKIVNNPKFEGSIIENLLLGYYFEKYMHPEIKSFSVMDYPRVMEHLIDQTDFEVNENSHYSMFNYYSDFDAFVYVNGSELNAMIDKIKSKLVANGYYKYATNQEWTIAAPMPAVKDVYAYKFDTALFGLDDRELEAALNQEIQYIYDNGLDDPGEDVVHTVYSSYFTLRKLFADMPYDTVLEYYAYDAIMQQEQVYGVDNQDTHMYYFFTFFITLDRVSTDIGLGDMEGLLE